MMFLEFFVWGAWYVTCGNFMAAHGMTDSIYLAYMVGPIAAVLSPFFLGMVADRFFASERVLAAMHLIGGGAMFAAAWAGGRGDDKLFIAILLVHMLAYMPTLGLTNAIGLGKLPDPEKQFPIIRVFGTLGWIAANLLVSKFLKADEKLVQFHVAGGAAIALGVFSIALPHTPPPQRGQPVSVRAIMGLDSLSLMKSPSFAIFIVSSFLICIPLAAYYAYAPVFVKAVGFAAPAAAMSLGQLSEVFFMIVMPLFFAVLGIRWMLMLGMLAWVVRYGFFAAAAAAGNLHYLVVTGILLHGMSYDFFFVAGSIYVEKKTSPDIRGQAQGFLVLVTQGAGLLVGAQLCGVLFNRVVNGSGTVLMHNWERFWIVPAIAALIVCALFFALFRDERNTATTAVPRET